LIAGIGAASGILDKPLQAAIIIMVILTTFIAPPLLRFAFQDEEADLAVEGKQQGNRIRFLTIGIPLI